MVSTGADGLVKLWGVRTSECTATFDEHDGKVPRRCSPLAIAVLLMHPLLAHSSRQNSEGMMYRVGWSETLRCDDQS